MPRNKKNKGNSGPTPAPNNNKAKSPAETKVAESAETSVAATLPVESEKSNEDLKARLVNAKERLHLLQEVIGGIGDPTDIENFKSGGIDAAKEKLNIIQDSVNSVKTTLLEVRQETARSVTPEGSSSGTNKKKKNKKHQNQNPPQGFVVREEPASSVAEAKSTASENESSALEQEDGNSTISKKKRNRNKKKKGQQEQSSASESLPQGSNVTVQTVEVDAIKSDEPLIEVKENSPEANKSKNNKKNNKKGQQKSTNETVESKEVKPADLNRAPEAEVKTENQPPPNDKNKNKNKNKKAEGNSKDTVKGNEPTVDQKAKIQDDTKETNTDKIAKDISKDKQSSTKTKEDPPSPKETQKKVENPKTKNDQKKGQSFEEKPAASVLATEISKAPEKEENIKAKPEPPKLDSPKNKKDKKKGQTTDAKVEEKQAEAKASCDVTSKTVVQAPSSEVVNIVTALTNEAIVIDAQPLKIETSKKDESDGQTAKLEEKAEKTIPLSTTPPIEEKKDSSTHQQTQKNKKNKQQCPIKTTEIPAEKPVESLKIEPTLKNVTDIISSERIVTDIPKAKNEAQCQEVLREPVNKNEACSSTPAVIPASPEKPARLDESALSTVQTEPKTMLDINTEIIKAVEPPKLTVEDIPDKNKIEMKIDATPSLPKLDFSQVVKDNKNKIPLMEIKPLPVLAAAEAVTVLAADAVTDLTAAIDSVAKPSTDAAIKNAGSTIESISEIAVTEKPIVDVVKIVEDVTTKLTEDTNFPSEAKVIPKLTGDTSSKSIGNIAEAKINIPVPTELDATKTQQNKAKTPERKGNQAIQKNEQKKPQQGKGQCPQQKQNDQLTKKDEIKLSEPIKADAVVPEKAERKSDAPASIVTTEAKLKEEIAKKNDNMKKEQGKQKSNENKFEAPKEKEVPQKQLETVEKQQPLIEGKADKDLNKKAVSTVVEVKAKAPETTQIKDNKSVSSTSPNSPTNRQPESQKQEHKPETSKKDQKKQNKMKGKAPQPPDIPMDMSLLSASMIDPLAAAADELISHEESEDQSSLITSDSKNVAGSDFVQSVDSLLDKANTDETKSLETISTAPKNENKVSEIEREAKNSSPSSSKRSKDMANLKESVEMQETKRQELPEKSAQQKLEPVQFPAVKLMDILEAKMTSPAVKPGNIAGNVRKLPKDIKRTDQLNVQQQKSRSKSPKENMAEKYVKNQKLATGDNKKQATQNIKKEMLKTEVGSLVTPISKQKEVKEPTKIDANLNESKSASGTASTTTAVTEAEQVGNLKESDAISKQKAEQLPANSSKSDSKLQQSNDEGKTGTAVVGGKKETINTKPKVAPKPNVPLASPKTVDRSKKSPAKTPENKTAGKETPVTSKSPAQAKPTPQSKPQGKQPAQTKSPVQSKTPSQTATTPIAVAKSSSQISDAQCADPKKPEVPPKPDLSTEATNKITPILQDEEEEFVEYKFSPRPVFISTACQICKVPLDTPNPCKFCQMVSYCSSEHERDDQMSHGPLCTAIQEIAKKRGELDNAYFFSISV